ncbi:unnamed protein product [Fraxinus pennsylvanica]|uniref:Uncharacterized protein n=1 Tax=Fraxinus pennsylvanica TaxID=56036 RepID=A0AAD2DSS6_9LAMI|nr:unnamed protein product [Fraxinus pennsylvanica]
MRNRFLAAAAGSVQPLDCIRLPLPHHPPPNNVSFSQDFLHSFHDIPVLSIPCKVDKLQTDNALSKFFSDVLPHVMMKSTSRNRRSDHRDGYLTASKSAIKSQVVDLIILSQSLLAECTIYGKCLEVFVYVSRHSLSFTLESCIQDGSTSIIVAHRAQCFRHFHNLDDMSTFLEDTPTSDLSLPNLLKIQQSVYSVDDISLEYAME